MKTEILASLKKLRDDLFYVVVEREISVRRSIFSQKTTKEGAEKFVEEELFKNLLEVYKGLENKKDLKIYIDYSNDCKMYSPLMHKILADKQLWKLVTLKNPIEGELEFRLPGYELSIRFFWKERRF